MHPKLKTALQYVVVFAITVALLWLSLRGLVVAEGENKSEFLWNAWKKCDKGYLLLMAAVAMLSHAVRAERWRMLLTPTGNVISFGSSFLSLMIGYLVNLAVPRGGEVSRCYNLYKLEQTPIEVSFGTVVVERLIDLICLILLIALSFFVEWDKLKGFIETLPFATGEKSYTLWIIAGVVGVGLLIAFIFLIRRNEKLKKLFLGFKNGLLAVFRLRNKPLFIFYSIAIWGLYFIMSYLVVLAFPETSGLGISAVLTLFAIGAIAMAAPLPGGAGSYHTLVPLGLVTLYNLPQTDAIAFVFIFHGWQTFIMIVAGVLSLFISYALMRWKKQPAK
ncbi:MAG TPA: lysylphosphatidylglycerol synthase transmembrane domain-containing protein [Cyclobacteriaceae bacterium]|nr:flippase-like domain-containing protein [Cytophagales bacterium]HNT51203.1 lysylphosphatidylglycerol synthase transmembrane domain-containing protein [Cyclobacteriaceae bacterium]HRE67978.1 lysylphosphatidylglycerol synthase transmembrane domain-containing protein [Cyclobacteriaceae bacterium]HRF33600.1 lysylphosphatidylglycerol synthase transmembrane domain-containing protein [Cyclobacteriaceae bacterium]